MPSSLEEFLAEKPLYYKEIDYDRFPRIYKKISHHLPKPKIIHLIGTNAKGSTGRFMAYALHKNGFRVGHYTSPHILSFHERIWIDGSDISDDVLENAHRRLLKILDQDDAATLSYFEYTTLLAMVAFSGCEYVVLEAGLGGEHDATAVFEKVLTVVTPIDLDHQAFLGNTIEAIATTKLKAMAKRVVIAKQKYQEVYEIAKKIASTKGAELIFVDDRYKEFVLQFLIPSYMQQNLQTALTALEALKIDFHEIDFTTARLFGRLTKIQENITVDVGHNPLAAKVIVKEFASKKVVLVYNSYHDKEYRDVLKILKPIIKRVEILSIEDERIVQKSQLQKILNDLAIQYEDFNQIKQDEYYLVFGSFKVIEEFLKRLHA